MANDQVSVEITIEEKAALRALTRLTQGIDKFEKETKQAGKTSDAAWSSFKGNLAAIAASGALRSIANGMANLVSGSIEAAASAEKISTQLEVLTGSADTAARLFEELKEFSATTPFQLEGIAQASAQLIAFGFSADSVKDRLQKIGDVAAGSGADLKDIALIYGQVAASGKLTGEKLLQLQERAIPIGPAIAKTMGVAEKEVRELVSAGKVTQEVFEKAFNSMSASGGMFAGGMLKQSKTLSGVTSTLKDNFSLLQMSIGEAFRPSLIAGAEVIIEKLQDLTGWVKANQKEISAAAGFVKDYMDMWIYKIEGIVKTETALDKVNKKLLEQDEKLGDLLERRKDLENSTGGPFGLFKEHDKLALKQVNNMIAEQNRLMQETVAERKKLVDAQHPAAKPVEAATDNRVDKEKEISAEILAARQELNNQLLMLEEQQNISQAERELAKESLDVAKREELLNAIMLFEQNKAEIAYNAAVEKAAKLEDVEAQELTKKIALRNKEIAIATAVANAEQKIGDARVANQQKMTQGFAVAINQAASLAKKGTAEQKVLATAAATINTYAAATRAYKDYPYPANIAVMATTIAAGLAQVKEITSASFATGGVLGGYGGASTGGDNTTANLRYGEMVLNGPQQKTLFDKLNNNDSGASQPTNLQITSIVQVDEREIARAVRNQRLEGFSI